MVFTAQTNRPDEKDQHKNQGRPQVQNRPQVQTRQAGPVHRVTQLQRVEPQQDVRRSPPFQRTQQLQPIAHQPVRQEWTGPRVYALQASAPAMNNQLFHHQHHKNWRPRYNFYENEYHFYPYVNIASSVDLSGGYVAVVFNGQNYYYDQGTFYLQDDSGQYIAVAPPVGIIVNPIAPQARQIIVNDQVYYRYKGVFYIQVAQGYQVVGPVEYDSGDS